MPNKYSKKDLLWEATRRNESYKKFYKKLIKEYSELVINNFYLGGNRWGITTLANPSVSIDQIKERISSGGKAEDVHPYYCMFPQKAVLYHEKPILDLKPKAKPPGGRLDRVVIGGTEYKWLCKFYNLIKNREVVFFDPSVPDSKLIPEFKKVKASIQSEIKKKADQKKVRKEMVYNIKEIDHYIKQLEMYDEIVKEIKGIDEYDIYVKNGSVHIPKGYSFNQFVPSIEQDKMNKLSAFEKAYQRAYRNAVGLIKSTPNIYFTTPRTKKSK